MGTISFSIDEEATRLTNVGSHNLHGWTQKQPHRSPHSSMLKLTLQTSQATSDDGTKSVQ